MMLKQGRGQTDLRVFSLCTSHPLKIIFSVNVVSAFIKITLTWLMLSFSLRSLVSIIRGQVLTADGTPLIGVNVTFVHYPEHGYTVTRKDGMYVY